MTDHGRVCRSPPIVCGSNVVREEVLKIIVGIVVDIVELNRGKRACVDVLEGDAHLIINDCVIANYQSAWSRTL